MEQFSLKLFKKVFLTSCFSMVFVGASSGGPRTWSTIGPEHLKGDYNFVTGTSPVDPVSKSYEKWTDFFSLSDNNERTISDGGTVLNIWYAPDLPSDAVITNVHYEILVDDNDDALHFYPSDYIIEVYAGDITVNLWDREGTLSDNDDNGNDDDPETDTDIYLTGDLDDFDGESANQIYSFMVEDANDFGGVGKFCYLRLQISWESPNPNLTCYGVPSGWDHPIVVNHTSGSHTEATVLYANITTYLNISFYNQYVDIPGGSAFDFWYSVDEGETDWGLFAYDECIPADTYTREENIELVMPEGTHEICQVVDLFDLVPETNTGDNEYCITRTWVGPPSAPVLASPADEVSDQPAALTLNWNSSTHATNYTIQLDDNSDFSSTLYDETVSGTSQDVTGLSVGTTYYWHVRAENPAGNSVWSDAWQFTCTSPDAITDSGQGRFYLGQNHPNPFSETTAIEFMVPAGGEITFEMLDLQGKQVESFSQYYIAGTHTLQLDLKGKVQPGVYFYRIITAGYTDSKMCIVR